MFKNMPFLKHLFKVKSYTPPPFKEKFYAGLISVSLCSPVINENLHVGVVRNCTIRWLGGRKDIFIELFSLK